MSDSEDDFMSDKYLLDLPSSSTSTSKSKKTYTEQRNLNSLKSLRKGQAKNQIPLRQLEEQRRKEGLSTSLFDQPNEGGEKNVGMGLMQRMGWNVGESLGKRSSPPPSSSSSLKIGGGGKRPKFLPGDELEEGEPKRGGLGSGSVSNTAKRTEPIRISMWSGRKGLSARSPSPPPLPKNTSGRDPDALDPEKLRRLNRETEGFRERQRAEYGEKERERKGRAGREKLREFDREKGVKFHPLHILPFSPLTTVPRPLLRLIYPSQVVSPSPSPPPGNGVVEGYEKESNLSAAEKMREQIRRDMLSTLKSEDDDDDGEEGVVRFGVIGDESREELEGGKKLQKAEDDEYEGVDWEEHVNGAKRVLSMDPSTYLQFVVDQLRTEHLYCFWCSYKYGSFEEMDGPGGCPGEEEDDH
ncbi:hypothetical protein I302_108456 [Kwoniella bestiolae CBS 10118]|uniref:G-patch domain-containing protein n=1 Tax=Kwoniella bestiolae CBS 10118 TaxID=1296100 RepID=A0A1B9FVN4_9TREE|nr:hypothetical protein I302_07170 [Kwoniella bestiolae CBS 10118]OCF22825.1 hypothetical protein I302_07170 [Kwoniella bestiolae CBS 10118]